MGRVRSPLHLRSVTQGAKNDVIICFKTYNFLGALSYAELGTLIPKSGGEYSYFMDGLGCLHRFWGPLPAFLYSWVSVLLMNPASIAVGCLSCAGYTIHPILTAVGHCPTDSELLVKLTALVYLGTTDLNKFNFSNMLKWNLLITLRFDCGPKLFQRRLDHPDPQRLYSG